MTNTTASCKSPAHRAYSDAFETLDVSAGQIVRDLKAARDLPLGAERSIAIQRAMEESAERIAWAQKRLDDATREVNAHFDRGCRNLQAVSA